jgi:transaldolase
LAPVYERTAGLDGRVSIEVDPRLSRDAPATAETARRLWTAVDRSNLFVKIPATREGLAAIDTEVDRRLDRIGTPEAAALKGTAAIANARLAYQAYQEVTAGRRWQRLARQGARTQRPLWASTGVKDPAYPDTMYVTELVARDTVNTMPGATLEAFADHGVVRGDTITGGYQAAAGVLDRLAAVGVDFDDVTDQLEREGLEKFEKSWSELGDTIAAQLQGSGNAG